MRHCCWIEPHTCCCSIKLVETSGWCPFFRSIDDLLSLAQKFALVIQGGLEVRYGWRKEERVTWRQSDGRCCRFIKPFKYKSLVCCFVGEEYRSCRKTCSFCSGSKHRASTPTVAGHLDGEIKAATSDKVKLRLDVLYWSDFIFFDEVLGLWLSSCMVLKNKLVFINGPTSEFYWYQYRLLNTLFFFLYVFSEFN